MLRQRVQIRIAPGVFRTIGDAASGGPHSRRRRGRRWPSGIRGRAADDRIGSSLRATYEATFQRGESDGGAVRQFHFRATSCSSAWLLAPVTAPALTDVDAWPLQHGSISRPVVTSRCVFVAAMATARPPLAAAQEPPESGAREIDYVIGPEDVLDIAVWDNTPADPNRAGAARRQDLAPAPERREGCGPDADAVAAVPDDRPRPVHPDGDGLGHRPRSPQFQGHRHRRSEDARPLRAEESVDRARRAGDGGRLHQVRRSAAGSSVLRRQGSDTQQIPFAFDKLDTGNGGSRNGSAAKPGRPAELRPRAGRHRVGSVSTAPFLRHAARRSWRRETSASRERILMLGQTPLAERIIGRPRAAPGPAALSSASSTTCPRWTGTPSDPPLLGPIGRLSEIVDRRSAGSDRRRAHRAARQHAGSGAARIVPRARHRDRGGGASATSGSPVNSPSSR